MTTVMSFANQLKAVYPHLTKTGKNVLNIFMNT